MNLTSVMMPGRVISKIEAVRRRRQIIGVAAIVLVVGALLFLLTGTAVLLDWHFCWTNPSVRWLAPLVGLGIVISTLPTVVRRFWCARPLRVEAREIDRAIPALEERWSTAMELATAKPSLSPAGSPELIARIMAEASAMDKNVNPELLIPLHKLRWRGIALVIATVGFAVICVRLSNDIVTLIHRFVAPWKAITLTRIETRAGLQYVPRQSPYEIRASLNGRLPATATLAIKDQYGAIRIVQLGAEGSVRNSLLTHRILQVDEPFEYQIQAGDALSPWVKVQPVERPSLSGFDVRVIPPAYTKQPASVWNSLPANVHALRGSRFEFEFSSDQPLALADLEVTRNRVSERIALQETNQQRFRFAADLAEAIQIQLLAQNAMGLRSLPAGCRIEVHEDQPPTVEVLETSEETVVSPDDTMHIEFEAKDDFGIAAAEIVVSTRKEGAEARETVIPIDLAKQASETAMKKSVRLDLKQFNLNAKTQISYAIRVRDNRNAETSASRQQPGGKKPAENGNLGKAGANDPTQTPPENPMTKRILDVPGQTCTASKNIRIEQFSGTFDREAREKKSLAIDAVLQGLRKAASDALAGTEQAVAGLAEDQTLDSSRAELVRRSLTQIEEGRRLAEALKKESDGTPYVFFGFQADALVKGGFLPAFEKLRATFGSKPAKPDLESAAVSLRWVLTTLDALTKQYTTLKEVQRAEDLLQQLKEMHLVFLEDMPDWLKSGAPSPYERRMLEVDAAFAKAYEDFLQKRRDVYMQLAELLAKYPDLQARFLENSKTATTFSRDELLRLKSEQEALQQLTNATQSGTQNEKALVTLWQIRLRNLQTSIANQAAHLAKSTLAWMPKELTLDLRTQLELGATEVSRIAVSITKPGDSTSVEALQRGVQTLVSLDAFEQSVVKVGSVIGRNAAYVRNRFEDIDNLRNALDQNRRFIEGVGQRKFAEALQAAQAVLNTDTRSITTQIQQEVSGFVGLGEEVHTAAKKLDDVIAREVNVPQRAAYEALQQKAYLQAGVSQNSAANGLDRSVDALDDLVTKAIQRMDEANAKRGPGSPGAPPSIEALLKALEEEKRAAMCLGICCQPLNIQVQTDWQRPGGNSGPGSTPQQQQQLKRMQAARENARAAARDAAKAQEQANQRAKEISRRLETALVSDTAPGMAKGPAEQKSEWNTVPSELRAGLFQESGQTPPKRYENAIREYFKSIAEMPSAAEALRNPPVAK